jgi:DNA-binding GntR family transcriptional regulator
MPDLSQLKNPTLGKTVSRTDLVEAALREWILTGQLSSGQQLVERELATVLGTSKTPVREALIILSRRGLVESNTYHGMTVRKVTARMIRSVQEARMMLEPDIVVASLSRFDKEALARAEAALERSAAAAREKDWITVAAENRVFHRVLYSQHENDVITSFLDQLQDQIALIALASWDDNADPIDEAAQHRDILAAVKRKDASAVRKLLKSHIHVLLKFADRIAEKEEPGK